MEEVFAKVDIKKFDEAIKIIHERVVKRPDSKFIEELVMSLNVLTENAMEVVTAVIPHLLSILKIDDDVTRFSLIVSCEKFVQANPKLIFPYIKEYLISSNPKDREGMLFILGYIAKAVPNDLVPYFGTIIKLLNDPEEFVRKEAVNVLKIIGKENRTELEALLIEFIKNNDDVTVKEAADEVLKGIVDILNLKKHELEKLEKEVRERVITEKKELLERTEQELKQIELEKKELELKKKMEDEAREKALLEQKKKIEEEERRLAAEKLRLEEAQKALEMKRIEEERQRIEKEKEVLKHQEELARVKLELEKKRIEEEKAKIIAEEAARIQQKMQEMQNESDSDDDYEDV